MKKFLLQYNFITILPFEETFFHALTLPKKIKLSKELLKINYLKYSPRKNINIIGHVHKKHLMLWFYTKNITSPIIVPESFLLYKELKKRSGNALFIIKSSVYKILIVKDGYLVSAFTTQILDDEMLSISSDEFSISNTIHIDEIEYKEVFQSAFKSLSIEEIYQFNQFDLDTKTIAKKVFEYGAYPLSFLLVFMMLVNYIHGSSLQSQIERLKENYIAQRDKNKKISQDIRKHNKDVKKWQEFVNKELLYTDPLTVLNDIYKIIKPKEKATLQDVSVNEKDVTLKLQTNLSPVIFLNRLSKIPYIQTVIIQNSFKQRNGNKIITYTIALKPLKEL